MQPIPIVYDLSDCPRCKQLIQWLECHDIKFSLRSLLDPAAKADLILDGGIYFMEAPVLQINNIFLTPNVLFRYNNTLNCDIIEQALVERGLLE